MTLLMKRKEVRITFDGEMKNFKINLRKRNRFESIISGFITLLIDLYFFLKKNA